MSQPGNSGGNVNQPDNPGYHDDEMLYGQPVKQQQYIPAGYPQQQGGEPGNYQQYIPAGYPPPQQQYMQNGRIDPWQQNHQQQQPQMKRGCCGITKEIAKILFRLFMAIAIINFTVGIFTIINNRESSAMSVAVFFLLLAFIFNTDWCGWGGPEKDRTGANGNQQV